MSEGVKVFFTVGMVCRVVRVGRFWYDSVGHWCDKVYTHHVYEV